MKTVKTLEEIIEKIKALEELILRAKTYCDKTRLPRKITTGSMDERGFNEKYYNPSPEIGKKVIDLIQQESLKEIEAWEKELANLKDPLNIAMILNSTKES